MKKFVDKAFGRRFTEACDNSKAVPEFNKGRLSWIAQKMSELQGQQVSIESVRKWMSGEARPRPDKMKALARVLRVDEGWLSLGLTPELTPEQKSTRNIFADGAINYVASVIQMSGAHIAFMEPGAPEAAYADFLAIIRGKAYTIKVALGNREEGGTIKFNVPNEYERIAVIGLLKAGPGEFRTFKIPTNVVKKHGVDHGGYRTITAVADGGRLLVKKDELPVIPDFETYNLAA